MELKPKSPLEKIEIQSYKKDAEDFKRILEHLNKSNKEEGEYTSEDLFRFILSAGIEKMPSLAKAFPGKRSPRSTKK